MKHSNFLSKTDGWSCSHGTVTSGTTVGSPSVHRRGTLLKLLSVLMLMVFGFGQMWAEEQTVTYTVSSTSAVSSSGTAPEGSSATYSQTYSTACQATKSNSFSLTLSGYAGCTIKGISLSMKSNSKGGAGNLSVTAGSSTIASIATAGFNNNSWYGSWSTDYVAVSPTVTETEIPDATNIVFSIAATANSLYCESYTITYEEPETGDVIVKTLKSIAVEGMTTSYETGNTFSFDGTCTATYSVTKNDVPQADESKTVTPTSVSSPDMTTAGEKTITVSFTDDNITKETTYNINVTAATKSSLVFTAACGGSGTASDGAEWTVVSDAATESSFDNTKGVHYGTGTSDSGDVQYIRLSTSDIEGTITKIVVNASTASGVTATVGVTVNGEVFGGEAQSLSSSAAEYTFTGSASGEIIVTITKPSKAAKALYCKSIVVSYIPAPQKQSTDLAYADELKNHLAKAGAAYTAPTLTNPYNLTGITYASSNADVVAVNASTGALTIKAAGKAVITASREADDTYKAGSASYTIYVATEAGTAADPLSEASAKALIDLGCTMEAHVHGVVAGDQDATKFTITLTGGMQFYKLKDLGNVAFETAYIKNRDEVTAVGSLLKYNNSTYELAEGCYLTAYKEFKEPLVTLKQSGSAVETLNVAATDVANQELDIVCDNFGGEITSASAKLYGESACETEITSEWLTDVAVNGAKLTFSVADNDGDARQVWLKVTASDGTDEAFAILTILQAKYVPDYAELPFEFDGGRADIASTNGMSQEGLGSDYNSSPKLKFDGTGDWLVIKINEEPGLLTYSIKNNTFSGGTFTVQESKDGTSYTEVASHTEITNTQNEEYNLNKDTRFVKFIYTEKVNGNVGLGNIEIAKYVAPAVKPTITTQPVGAEYTQNDTPDDLTIAAEAAKGGALSYQWYSNSSASTEGAVAIEGADETEYTPSTASIATTYYYCVVTEAGADEPTTSDIVAIEVKAAPVVTGTYELFDGTLEEGDYVIYASSYAMKNTVTSSRFDPVSVTPEDDKISNPDASLVWHIAPATTEGYWTIYNEGVTKYAGGSTTNNQATLLDDTSTDYALWEIVISGGEATVSNKGRGSDRNLLQLNSSNYKWGLFTSGQVNPTLYKKAAPAAPFAVTLATCENGSVGAMAAEAITSGDEVLSGTTITLSNTPAPGCQFVAYEVYKTEDPTKKVTVKENAGVYTFKMPAYAVTISATFSVIPVLDDIALSGEYQTTFWQGVPFSSNGLVVTASYTNVDPVVVTPTSITNPDMNTPGVKAITVTYTEGEVTKEKSYDITVKAVPSTQDNPYTVAETRSLYDAYHAASIAQPTVFVKGVVTSASMEKGSNAPDAYKNKAYNVYVKDAETDGSVTFEFYRMLDGREVETPVAFTEGDITEGDTLIAVGTLSKYNNSVYEFSAGCSLEVRKEFKAEKVDISNTPETAYTPAKAIELYNDPTSDLTKEVYVKGVVTGNPSFVSGKTDDEEKWNGTYNVYVRAIGDESQNPTKFEFYRMYSDGSEGKFNDGDIVTLDTIIAKGILSKYNSTYEFAQGCVMIEHIAYHAPVVAVESIELAAAATVKVGKTVQLTANVLPENASNKEVIWSVKEGDEAYAEVSATGLVKGLEIGEAVIRATSVADANIYAECTVTVEAAPVTIKFNKVTSTEGITNGEYLIVYEDGNVAFDGSLTTLDAENNTIDVVVEDGVIELENTNAVFTIDATAGTIQSASGKYIGRSSDANGMEASETALENTLTIEEGNFVVEGTAGAYLRYNKASNQNRFRYYKSTSYEGQEAIQLYKRDYGKYTREVPANQYGTICLPNGGNISGATIYEVAYFDNAVQKIFFDEVLDGKMEAGMPYIFLPDEDVTKLEVVYTDAENKAAGNHNGLWGSYEQTALPIDGQHYILYNNQYWEVNSVAYVGANRGYLKIGGEGDDFVPKKAIPVQQGRRRVAMGVNGEQNATGVDEVQGDNVQGTKVLINNRLFILRGEKMYDATGRLVK